MTPDFKVLGRCCGNVDQPILPCVGGGLDGGNGAYNFILLNSFKGGPADVYFKTLVIETTLSEQCAIGVSWDLNEPAEQSKLGSKKSLIVVGQAMCTEKQGIGLTGEPSLLPG